MKIVSFAKDGQPGFGIVVDGGIVDCTTRIDGCHSVAAVLAGPGVDAFTPFRSRQADMALEAVDLLPPIPAPGKIICVGVNFGKHLEETGRPTPEKPMLFTRFASTQIGAGAALVRPHESIMFDFEGELAVVIGTGGRRIARADAMKHVAGYGCYNDGSIRDWQRHTSQFTPGKNFDGTGAFGPWLATPDEAGEPADLVLETRLNGEVMQRAEVSDLIFDIPALIEYCSAFATLDAGDVIVTGTPGGVGAFRQPPVWLKAGDVVEVEISGIGVLRNPVVDEA